MSRNHSRLLPLAALLAALTTFDLGAVGATAAGAGIAAGRIPIVTIDGGRVRGVAVPCGFAFRGLPYAAPPTGRLRWRPPQPPAQWKGIRDARVFAPSCPQPRHGHIAALHATGQRPGRTTASAFSPCEVLTRPERRSSGVHTPRPVEPLTQPSQPRYSPRVASG